ncbi:hypothetical protein [Pelosinus baikalensis]|uniref:hypothetical protein n=1 Tax=Pelosinus baikalensis TaxID=2892015 RepID=UPI00272BD274|nr:hypothetical protein [Pelosinus baikalensis]
MTYVARKERYDTMKYNYCGNSGLKISAISLGLWHNFGDVNSYENSRAMSVELLIWALLILILPITMVRLQALPK